MRSPVSWWKSVFSVLTGTLVFIGLVLGVLPLFSQEFRDFFKNWWILGWILVLVLFICSAVLYDRVHRLQKAIPELKRNEVIADLATVDEWFAPFMRDGEIRAQLASIPHRKHFSKALCRPFYKLEQDFNDTSKEIFNKELEDAIDDVKTAYKNYWYPLDDLLDAPYELRDDPWDLRVMEPPGGNWDGDTTDKQFESYYIFIRSLEPLQRAFLDAISAVEKTAHRLRVQSGIIAETSAN